MTEPYYTKLSPHELAQLKKLVTNGGYQGVILGLADILTQAAPGPPPPGLSLALGMAAAEAGTVDKERRE